jgi:DNA damage-inducible protein 1
MSQKCAEKCGVMKLLDTRFQGIAQGVGTSKILGRIHAAQIQIGSVFFTTSLTILEDDKVDMLFGLDNLKRHRCCIDLDKNELTLDQGKVIIPFLKDHEIQRGFGSGEESKDEEGEKDTRTNEDKLTDLMAMGYDEKE